MTHMGSWIGSDFPEVLPSNNQNKVDGYVLMIFAVPSNYFLLEVAVFMG